MRRNRTGVGTRHGATLVELIVCFMLLELFCIGFVQLVTNSVKMYDVIMNDTRGQEVSQILMEKIVGEISGAQGGVKTEYTLNVMDRSVIPVSDRASYLDESYKTKEVIAFCNRTGSPIYITTRDGYLLIHYRPVNDENKISLKAVDWTFDNRVYNGYHITSLQFSLCNTDSGKRTNVIQINLTIQNDSGYTVHSTEYAECYYFMATEVNKIAYKGIQTDEAYQAAVSTP